MGNKLITDEGKNELLRLAFKREEAGGAFNFIALGGVNSKGAQGEIFSEVQGSNYSRVQAETDTDHNKKVIITGTFNEENYAPTDGSGLIKEIGLCNNEVETAQTKFFMYAEVPEAYKNGDISLQYSIIISID